MKDIHFNDGSDLYPELTIQRQPVVCLYKRLRFNPKVTEVFLQFEQEEEIHDPD